MKDRMKPSDGILPYRYSGVARASIHIRMTDRMRRNLLDDSRLCRGVPQRIRYILERYLSSNTSEEVRISRERILLDKIKDRDKRIKELELQLKE